MKTIKAFVALAFAIGIASFAKAQNYNSKLDGPFTKTMTVKVSGVCEMCKHRIESAVKTLSGIWSADWNVNAQILSVTYDRTKLNPNKVRKAVAAVGHDAGGQKASDIVYATLPDCCHYTRKS